MNTVNLLFPTTFLEERPSTKSRINTVVYSADTNNTHSDVLSAMSEFLTVETSLIKEHRQNMRSLYPSLYVRGK